MAAGIPTGSRCPAMIAVSVFTGRVAALPNGRPSAIVKFPATLPLSCGPDGLAGDEQADLRVHGGPDKAVHFFPAPHYPRLAALFPQAASRFVPGSMGENLCGELDEAGVHIGDIWKIGSVHLQVCQPRVPCWKIDERFATDGIAERIAAEDICGWYWRVVQGGRISSGDGLDLLKRPANSMSLRDALTLCAEHRPAQGALARLIAAPGIAAHWQRKLVQRQAWLLAQESST